MDLKQPQIKADFPVPLQLLRSTARIESKNSRGEYSVGTGFFFQFCKKDGRHVPCIVTNKHVIEDSIELTISYQTKKTGTEEISEEPGKLILVNPKNSLRLHPEEEVDLAIILLGEIVMKGIASGYEPTYMPIDSTLIPSEEDMKQIMVADPVLMVGYPNGLWDSKNNSPLMRKGICATLPKFDFEGKPDFVVDMACLPGSSGSPVFLYDTNYHVHVDKDVTFKPRCKLLGVLHSGPTISLSTDDPKSKVEINAPILNLGYVVKSRKLLDLDDMLEREMTEAIKKRDQNKNG